MQEKNYKSYENSSEDNYMTSNKNLVNMPAIGFGTYLIPNEEAQGTINTVLKIDKEKISSPVVQGQNLYVAKNNSIIKLN